MAENKNIEKVKIDDVEYNVEDLSDNAKRKLKIFSSWMGSCSSLIMNGLFQTLRVLATHMPSRQILRR